MKHRGGKAAAAERYMAVILLPDADAAIEMGISKKCVTLHRRDYPETRPIGWVSRRRAVPIPETPSTPLETQKIGVRAVYYGLGGNRINVVHVVKEPPCVFKGVSPT